MQNVPQTMALGARVAVEELKRRGVDPMPLLKKAGLEHTSIVAENALIPHDKSAMLLELAAAEAQDDLFGLVVGEAIDPRDLGAVSYVGFASDTLGEALANFQRYLELISQTERISLSYLDDVAFVTTTPRHPNIRNPRHPAEAGAVFLVRFCQHLAGEEIVPVEIRFTHRYAGGTAGHEAVFGCPVIFGQKEEQVLFRHGDLSARIDSADDRLKRILQSHCDYLMEKNSPYTPDFIAAIRGSLLELLPKQKAKAKIVAEHLGISERTLTRRLQNHATDFREVRDAVRRDLAHEYLRGSDETLAHIAYLLDYSSQSAFSASFKQMTGKTPSEVRKGDL